MNTNQKLDQTAAATPQEQTQNQNAARAGRGGNRGGGRTAGSKAKIPTGHLDIHGLANLMGVKPGCITKMEERGDDRIPPRSPLAGPRRAIWRICDIEANIEELAAKKRAERDQKRAQRAASQPSARGDAPHPTPDAHAPRRPGRPRGTGKFSK